MWPWRRRSPRAVQRSTADAPGPPTDEPTTEPGAGTTQDTPDRVRGEPPAWQSLPPLQRITPDEPRLNLPETFSASLAAWRDPSYLAPLGHLVGPAEPAGVLHDTAVPVSGPSPTVPEPVGRPVGGDLGPLPLATPPPVIRRPAHSLQRQVTGGSAAGSWPEPPPAEPSRAVPVAPVTVSRLLTAPAPPEELHLPTVDEPVELPEPTGRDDLANRDAPTGADTFGAATTSTLGRDDQAADDAHPTTSASAPAGTARPGVGDPRPATVDLPVQRVAGDGPRPARRLGLGEPIVSPLLPPAPRPTEDVVTPARARTVPGAGGTPLVQRSRAGDGQAPPAQRPGAGDGVAPLVQRSPADAGGTVAGPTTSPDNPVPPHDPAPLVGDGVPTVSRLGPEPPPAGLGPSPTAPGPGPGSADGDRSTAAGMPVAGLRHHDAGPTPPAGDASSGGPTPVQRFAPPDDRPPDSDESGVTTTAPLLGEPVPTSPGNGPAAATRGDTPAADPTGPGAGRVGGDLPVVARLTSATPTVPDSHSQRSTAPTAADIGRSPGGADPSAGTGVPTATDPGGGPGLTSLVGGSGSSTPDLTGDPADRAGPGEAGRGDAPLPLVVARLVGDRPTRLVTGVQADSTPPSRPAVQRVTWQRAEAPAPAGGGRTEPSGVVDRYAPPAAAREPAVTVDRYTLPEPAAAVDRYPTSVPTVQLTPSSPLPTGLGRAASGTPLPAGSDGGGLPPVQRWVGALPAAPLPAAPRDGTPAGPQPPSATPPSAYLWAAAPGPVVQRAEPVDAAPPVGVPPVVDALPPGDPPAPPAPPAVVASPGDGGTAGPPAAPGAAPAGGVEPEELLKKLYDPLLRRLKTELRLDRERHGVLGGPG